MTIRWKDYDPTGLYNELIQSAGRPREWARSLSRYFSSMKDAELIERRTATELAIQAMGITFTVYSQEDGSIDRAGPFDFIPRNKIKWEWVNIENGLK